MKNSITLLAVFCAALCVQYVAVAQEAPSFPSPGDEHKWLAKFVGHWQVTSTGSMGEGQPPVESTGTITSKMLGGFWVTNVMDAEVAGFPFKGIQTIGYDPQKKKYVGTWVDSTNHVLWTYEGSVDESGKKLVLAARGPDMTSPGKMRNYRDAYEFTDADTMVSTSTIQNEDGSWTTFMRGKATKVENTTTDEESSGGTSSEL